MIIHYNCTIGSFLLHYFLLIYHPIPSFHEMIFILVYINYAAPSAPPTSVSVFEVTSSSITAQWGPVNCIHRNGDITGYSVQYGEVGSGSTQTMPVSGGSTTSFTVTGLMLSTNYSIEVAAESRAGTGPYSTAILTETRQSK